jgi:molecular chaperone DnaK
MVKDAAAHESEDKQRKAVIDARNQCDALAYQVEKTLAENREKVPVGELSKVESALAAAKTAAQGDDLAAITKATDDLQRASHAVAEALYKTAQAGSQPTGAGATDAGVKEGEVVDAEYAETK